MKHLFIINPAAGSRNQTEDYRKKIAEVCEVRGLDYGIRVSGAPGRCCKIAREAAETGEEYRIYACGGDGTLNEVVNGAAGFPNVSVTVFPAAVATILPECSPTPMPLSAWIGCWMPKK